VGGEPVLPRDIDWPDGFETIFGYAMPGAQRPRLFDAIAALGGDSPHHGYPLRQIGETRFAVRRAYGGDGEPIGTISHQQALREAAPGMTYLHAGRVYRVRDWRNLSHDRSVRVEPIKSGARTHPLLYKSVNLSIGADGVIEGRLLSNDTGFLAETQLQVMEAVDGYRIGKTTLLYRDLRQANPAMTRKQYEFATTGIVLQIDEPWFKGTSQAALNTRRSIGRALRQLVMRERSISGSEIDFADSNIAIFDAQGPRRRTDCLVIYDCVYGGLRLTESLFSHFLDYLRRLARAGAAVGEEALLSSTLVDRLIAWFSTLSAANPHDLPELAVDREGDDYVIYAPNSEVAIMHQGVLCPRILLEPQIMSIGESDMLMYRYETAPGASAYVAHDRIHPVGHNWRRALWDARSNQVREFDL
jgi:DEAD/DEAH box helicase domain-containing protein